MPTQYFSVRPKILTHFPNRHLNFAPVQKSSNKAEKTADGANLLLQEAKVQIIPPPPPPHSRIHAVYTGVINKYVQIKIEQIASTNSKSNSVEDTYVKIRLDNK